MNNHDTTVSTEELLRQMSLARQAVENARQLAQLAQLHVSAAHLRRTKRTIETSRERSDAITRYQLTVPGPEMD